jgi:hypothetical protein
LLIGRRSKPVRPTAAIASLYLGFRAKADAAENARRAPQAHRHEIIDMDREGAVEIGRLRQIGKPLALGQRQPALERRKRTGDALEQRRLAGAIGSHDRRQAAMGDLATEVMHRRVAVIAERQIVEADSGHGRKHSLHMITASVAAQTSTITPTARPSRFAADKRSSDQPGSSETARRAWLRLAGRETNSSDQRSLRMVALLVSSPL